MARLKVGTPEFEAAFAGVVDRVAEFTSRMPTHRQLQDAFLDPSLRGTLGLDSVDSILGRKTQDIRLGAQVMFFDLAADLGTQASKLVSFPSDLLQGLRAVMQSAPIANALTDEDVFAVFSGDEGKALKAAGNVLLGAGLAAVGTAIPVVGQIGAAIVAIGRGIYAVLEKQKATLDRAREEYRELLWASFPDLQTADSTTDAGQVQYGVRPILASNDWTKLVLPRFRGEWVGVERKKGFAFAPGKTTKWSNTFGEDVQAFEPSGGLGLIPGTNVLTSVIQVSLDPRGQAMQSFLKTGYYDPRVQGPPTLLRSGAQYVIDTGTVYEATRNLCILAWEQAQVRGSPFMYRFDVKLMDERWREYCEGGIEFIKSRVFPWYAAAVKYRTEDRLQDLNLEGFLGSSVFYAIGSWACDLDGGTSEHPIFKMRGDGYGSWRDQMKHVRHYPNSVYSGAFLPILNPDAWWEKCMGNIYSRTPNIRKTLEEFSALQRWCLRRTLVCAYVRESDAAFRDPALLDLLRKMRAALLTSQARFGVNMLDVPEGERHAGSDWRDQLLKSGVPKLPNKFLGGNKRVQIAPGEQDEPEPKSVSFVPGDLVPPAWKGDDGEHKPTTRNWWPAALGTTGVALAAGWAWSRRKQSSP